MKTHRFAKMFPEIDSEEREFMKIDIAANGLIEPITMILVSDNGQEEEQILDGANRNEICQELGIKPECIRYEGENPLGFVISKNMRRRHLSAGQKAMLAHSLMREADWTLPPDQAMNSVGVGKTSFHQAARLIKERPDLAEQVESGDQAISSAYKLAFPVENENHEITRGIEREKPASERIERELRWASSSIRQCMQIAGEVTLSEKAVGQIVPLVDNLQSRLAEFKLVIDQDHVSTQRDVGKVN